MVQFTKLLMSTVVALAIMATCVSGNDALMAFPDRDWEEATPKSQRVDGAKLQRAVDQLEKDVGRDGVRRFAIIRNGRLKWPSAPRGTFAASGFNNNKCFVVPEWKMVVVRLSLDGNVEDIVWSEFFRRLGSAVE